MHKDTTVIILWWYHSVCSAPSSFGPPGPPQPCCVFHHCSHCFLQGWLTGWDPRRSLFLPCLHVVTVLPVHCGGAELPCVQGLWLPWVLRRVRRGRGHCSGVQYMKGWGGGLHAGNITYASVSTKEKVLWGWPHPLSVSEKGAGQEKQ